MLRTLCSILEGLYLDRLIKNINIFREFSRENDRVENRSIFLRNREAEKAKMAIERKDEVYQDWINEGENGK